MVEYISLGILNEEIESYYAESGVKAVVVSGVQRAVAASEAGPPAVVVVRHQVEEIHVPETDKTESDCCPTKREKTLLFSVYTLPPKCPCVQTEIFAAHDRSAGFLRKQDSGTAVKQLIHA